MSILFLILLSSFSFAQEAELRESVNRLAGMEELIESLNEQDCLEDNRAFTEVTSGITVACASAESREGHEEMKVIDCTGDGKIYPGGYRIRGRAGVHPLIPEKSLYLEKSTPPERKIEFWSRNGALNETYIYLYDEAGGPDSHNTKSMMFVLPRKVIPSVKVVGNNVEVTMNTGEKVVFDKTTSAIKSGAMKEGPIDLTTDRHRRQPPNVSYSGSGISIRLNHRYLDPVLSGEIAEVRQGNKSCKIPRAVLLDNAGKLKSQSDVQFVKAINKSCPDQGFRI